MAALINNSTKASSVAIVSTLSSPSFAVGGNNRVLYVGVLSGAGSPVDPSGVKWGGSGGVALTQVGTTLSVGSFWKFSLWRLIAPTAQTSTVYVSWASTQEEVLLIAVATEDTDQTTPNNTVASGIFNNSVTPSKTATSVSGDLVLDFCAIAEEDGVSATISATAGQASLQEIEGSTTVYETFGASTKTASGTTTTMGWTGTAATTHAYNGQFAFALNGAAASPTFPPVPTPINPYLSLISHT